MGWKTLFNRLNNTGSKVGAASQTDTFAAGTGSGLRKETARKTKEV